MEQKESNIAQCYILYDGNESDKCEFTTRKLRIVYRGKESEFPVETLVSMTVHQKKLLIPIIVSGILTPLISAGFFMGLFHPIPALFFIIGGVFAFYFGWMGEKVFTVNLTQAYRDFPVKIVSANLKAFMDFVNQYIKNEPLEKRVLYLEAKDLKDPVQVNNIISEKNIERNVLSFWDLQARYADEELDPSIRFIMIDPMKIGSEVKYETTQNDQKLVPVIKGKIQPAAISGILDHKGLSKLFD